QVTVSRKATLANSERYGKESEHDPLITTHDGDDCDQQRMSVKPAVPDAQTWHGDQITKQTKGDKCATGDEKKPTRTAHQKIAKCSPAVSKRFQMRRVRCASVAVQSDGHLGDFFAVQTGFNDHLRGELHTCATLVKPFVHGLGKTTQTAVNVVDWCAEPSSCEKGENWIANPTM